MLVASSAAIIASTGFTFNQPAENVVAPSSTTEMPQVYWGTCNSPGGGCFLMPTFVVTN
ncbi:hypothetical protein [Belliella baltica]|nr:hypothetical protein [Belliella baltica]